MVSVGHFQMILRLALGGHLDMIPRGAVVEFFGNWRFASISDTLSHRFRTAVRTFSDTFEGSGSDAGVEKRASATLLIKPDQGETDAPSPYNHATDP